MLAAALGIAACTGTTPPPVAMRSGIVATSPFEARARAAAELRRLGFAVRELDGSDVPTLRAELAAGGDPGWARCEGIWTTDPFSDLGQSRFVAAEGRRMIVVLRTSALPQGTSVEVDAHTIGVYRHAFTGEPVEALCGSTGVLERRLVAAAGKSPTAPSTAEDRR
ncbi:MAG: hypothetical protein NZ555_05125 [Geminicoccaceae bacterium]|nr:hypothetical protein [Geminicoccaceae bacterium]MCX8100081.1 hypothetical protein [Geminicoccaceae bacterium]MDW8371586.1 hypothetical protein [Geminicoccaceae bacterium]